MTVHGWWRVDSPDSRAGAIALVRVCSADLEVLFDLLRVRRVATGQVAVREIPGVDQVVIAKWDDRELHIMPHGGATVMRLLRAKLTGIGLLEQHGDEMPSDPAGSADTTIDAAVVGVLGNAMSPLAIDLVLDQPRRIAARIGDVPPNHAAELRNLLRPPLVVALGGPNIGKSTLANALAGRAVSIVSSEPGTTRDHVGFLVNVDGLVIRYVDTPGVRIDTGDLEREAIEIALSLVHAADLVLWCVDAQAVGETQSSDSRVIDLPAPYSTLLLRFTRYPQPSVLGEGTSRIIQVLLRSDLCPSPSHPGLAVSVHNRVGVAELGRAIRTSLVSDGAMRDPGVWRFWEE